MNDQKPLTTTTRRDFLKTSVATGAVLSAPSIFSGNLLAAGSNETLKVGLVGCGSRGLGAAAQALSADNNVQLVAVADAFEDVVQNQLATFRRVSADKPFADRIKVSQDKCFFGLDAYQKVIDTVDVVLLCTPPGFRPMHLAAAVKAGKHVFCEKPVATDAPGVRSVLETAKLAKEKNLSIVTGFCWRYEGARREFYKKIHDGAIGDIRAIHASYYTSPVKPMQPLSQRPKEMGDLEWQIRNWYNFVWLSGDGLVEQAVHSIDKIAWAMKDASPLKAIAVGGRCTPNNQGQIFDHVFVTYEFENDVRAFMGQRQMNNTYNDVFDCIMGTEGVAKITNAAGPVIRGKETWRYRGPKTDMYQQEHNELFASIRGGKPINDGEWMAHSTMLAIMGRMSAYTGQEVTWDEAINSKEKLTPENLDWKMKLDIAPMAVPGTTKLT
jgi:predicted dehydrogenase